MRGFLRIAGLWLLAALIPLAHAQAPSGGVPRSGLGTVMLEPGQSSLEITRAVGRFLPPGTDPAAPADFASYLADFANPAPVPVTRIVVLDTGAFGAGLRARTLDAPALTAAIASNAGTVVEVIENGVRPRVRIVFPAREQVTLAFRFDAPVPGLTVELWDEPALARTSRANQIAEGLILGLVLAIAGYAAGLWVSGGRRDAGPFAALATLAFLAIAAAFAVPGRFELWGSVTHASVASGLLALCGAAALLFVRQALAWRQERPALSRGAVTGAVLLSGIALAAGANLPYAAMAAIGSSALAIAASALAALLSSISGRRAARLLAPSAVLACFSAVPAGMMFAGGTTQAFVMLCAALLAASLLAAGFSLIPSGAAPARVIRQPGMAAVTAAFAPSAARGNDKPVKDSGHDTVRLALASAHLGIFDWDLVTDTLSLSPSLEALLDARPGELAGPGRDWRARIHADDFDTFRTALEEYRGTAEISFALEFRARGADGVVRWLQLQGSTLSNGGRAVRCIGLAGDITAQKDHEASLIAAVRHDGLTGLPNRIVLMEALAARLASANPVHKIALLVADIDRFKTFNDALGTQAGDVLLATTGERLRHAAPPHALAARLGADRFALLWSAGEEFEAAAEADAVLAALGEPLALGGQDIYPAASGGLALAEAPAPAGAHLAAAELALEAAKRGGGGQLSLFAPSMRLPGEERIALESELRRALERGEIEVQYQPIVDTADGIAAGFEALLRWRHPVHGLLAADSFVSIAEETGIIVALGRYVLEQAARQLAVWNRIAPVFVSVNISPRQMMRADFPRLCEAALEAPGLAPGSLKFEVTENLVMENPEAASRLLARLKALGAGLAIDDFGVGHSTLQRLSGLPFDTIKIDKSFLTGPGADRALVSGLLALAREMGLTTIAEGVESAETMAFLADAGCKLAQGYYCGAPMDAASASQIVGGRVVRQPAA